MGKWTKIGPSLDKVLAGSFFDLYLGTMQLAFAGGTTEAALIAGESASEQTFVEEMNWTAVRGKRLKDSIALMGDRDAICRLAVLSLASEPIRALLRCLFSFSRAVVDSADKNPPPLCNFITPRYSPVCRILEYVSSFLSGLAGRRLSVLLMLCRIPSHADLWRSHKDIALQLRRALLLVSSWVYHRHQCRLEAWPYRLATLADHRLGPEEHNKCAIAVFESRLCCLDPYMTRTIREAGLASSSADLCSDKWREALRQWALRVGLTNAQLEFHHAAQKHLTPAKTSHWTRFAAKCLAHDLKRVHRLDQEELQVQPTSDTTASSSSHRTRRRQPDIFFFHKRCLQRDRAENPHTTLNGCTKEYWRKVKAEWAALPLDSDQRQLARMDADVQAAEVRLAHVGRQQARQPQQQAFLNEIEPRGKQCAFAGVSYFLGITCVSSRIGWLFVFLLVCYYPH